MKFFLYVLLMMFPLHALASSTDNQDIASVKQFLDDNPLIEQQPDETGLVALWLRIEGLHDVISLWQRNPEAFKQLGPEDRGHWRMQILKRVWSHLLYAKYSGDDEQVRMLTAIIRLHANFAEHYINNHIGYPYYAEVVEFARINGRYPAEQIMQKYGNKTQPEDSN